ncbi:MAG: Mov34/MPN/PAD-1 family protein [Chloroflexi bacterium]|nr:Mov34/MPN/PAD-1 family protein [Chloroflexota bacterium]
MTSRVKILSQETTTPVSAPMPLAESLKWASPYEQRVDGRVEIFFAQSALLKCVEHTTSDLEHEVGGVLVGQVRVDPSDGRPYVVIQDILPALHTDASQTHVTFTQATLVQLHIELEDRFPDKRIVGWYHTHPNLGVFMSGYDKWLHENFFNDPTHVALVVDPGSERGGFFCWQANHRLDPVNYVGFHELGDVTDESVVEWNNLEPVIDV